MGTARKLVEKTREIVRALGIYRTKEGEQVRADARKTEGKWQCSMPISWTLDIHRICAGRVQIGLLLRIFAHTLGAPRRADSISVWSPGYIDEDWAKELDVARNTARDAIEDAVKRGLIARQSEDPKAKGRGYYKLKLLPENWPAIADPITPKKQPAVAETPENEDKRPAGTRTLHRVRAGLPVEFRQGHRYEFEVPATVFENYLDAPGKMILNTAGLLRIESIKAPAPVVEMVPKKDSSVENKRKNSTSRSGGLQRNVNLADIPLTATALRNTGFRHDEAFIPRLFKAIGEAVTESGGQIEQITDALVARGVAECRYPKQTSAGGFVKTVPGWVAVNLQTVVEETPDLACRNCGKSMPVGVGSCGCTVSSPAPVERKEESSLAVYLRNKKAMKDNHGP